MSQLDQILERSRSPGQFVERRRFTLSRDKAIEKLREFSLRNPRQYVLELVQSAVFAGATYVSVDVNPDQVLLAWVGGVSFAPTELEGVFDYLFADRGERGRRHLVQLAIGLNALLQRKPRVLRIESGDGSLDGTVRMDLDGNGRGTLGKPADPLAGTYVLAEFGTNWLKRFQGDTWTPEAGLVEENCRFTPVPILLNGRAPFGYKASRHIRIQGLTHAVPFDEDPGAADSRRGVVALTPPTGRPGFDLVIGGVRVTTLDLPELGVLPLPEGPDRPPRGLCGVICDDGLRKTADQSDVVRDARFAAMLRAVQPHATRLIRQVAGAGYQAPSLPHVATAAASAEPLPPQIRQLGVRGPLTMESVSRFDPALPLFRVRPDDVDLLIEATDPFRFPYPALELTDGQVETLEDLLPDRAVHRLTTAADVDFVRRAFERHQAFLTHEEPWRDTVDPSIRGVLRLRLTLDGPAPAWGDPLHGDTPVLLVERNRSMYAAHLPSGLPRVSAVLVLERQYRGELADLAERVADRVLDLAWQLVPGAASPLLSAPAGASWTPERTASAVRPLVAGLLAAHVRPHFVRRETGVVLDASFPAAWGEARAAFRATSLADTTRGPLTLQRLLALQGTEEVDEVLDPADLALLAPLEERLGVGHLLAPALARVVASVVRVEGGWRWWGPRTWDLDRITHVTWLGLTLRPQVTLAGWRSVPGPLSALGYAAREGQPAETDWDAAHAMLMGELERLHRAEAWASLAPEPDLAGRVEQIGRLAVVQLAGALGRAASERLFRTPGAARWQAIGALLEERPDFAVVPRHGPALPGEPDLLSLTLDELKALEGGLERPLPLRLDDAPEVWTSLADPEDRSWLVRQEVAIPGLSGWLGLRVPFDDTSGVLLQTTGAVVALPSLDRILPCHGLLRLTGGQLEPTTRQLELLALARHQLYQALVRVLGDPGDPERTTAAGGYATLFALAAWKDAVEAGRDGLQGTAAALARLVHLDGPEGGRWGSLARWLGTPEHERPPLPMRLRASVRSSPARRPAGRPAEERLLARVEDRLLGAAGQALNGVELVVTTDYGNVRDPVVVLDLRRSNPEVAVFEVNLGHAVAFSLVEGRPHATELILLELARLLCRWGRRYGRPLDLPELQRALVAQRLALRP